jgi:hypothetical protein
MPWATPSRQKKKGRLDGRPILSLSASSAEEVCALAEVPPGQHHKSQTFFERQNLKKHWITSFTLVEHEKMVRPFFRLVHPAE